MEKNEKKQKYCYVIEMSGEGIGFGKTIVFNEHFVVYGIPAIVSAIGKYTIARFSLLTSK